MPPVRQTWTGHWGGGGKWQGEKARDQGRTASACHCPTLSSNSPVLLMLLTKRKLIWTPGKTVEPRTHLCPFKKKRHQRRALFQQGGEEDRVWEGRFWWVSVEGSTVSAIRWEGTEDTVEYACPAMMTRWLRHHCACLRPPLVLPPQDTSKREEGDGGWGGASAVSCSLIISLAQWRCFLPKSLPAHPWARDPGELLISEAMENGPRHTLQIGSDCLGVKRWELHEAC